jgi:hypothetical protein
MKCATISKLKLFHQLNTLLNTKKDKVALLAADATSFDLHAPRDSCEDERQAKAFANASTTSCQMVVRCETKTIERVRL